MTHSILLLSRYNRKGPSSRVRHHNFVPALERAGFRVEIASFLDDEYLERFFRGERRGHRLILNAYWRRLRQLLTARRYDLIWVEKEALPWLPAAFERMFFGGKPLVIDFDDPWHLRYSQHRYALVRAILGRKLETVAAGAKVFTAGSATLARWASAAGAPYVVELPPAVAIERYPLRPLPDGPFTVGWVGTPRNEGYLALIAEPLRRLHAAHGARLRLIGGSGRFSLPGVAIDQVTWHEETEAEELARCHVGVMPLADGAWERGKCGYKLIQYMAAGRPAVASPVGAAAALVVADETGYLADGAQEWLAALDRLAADRERARELGLAARRRAEAQYSLHVQAPRLIEVFRAAVGRAGPPDGGRRLDVGHRLRAAASRPPSEH